MLRLLFMWMATYIGYYNQSELIKFIKNSVFYIQFFNTGLLLLLASWDSREVNSGFTNTFFNGLYTDYNSYWFQDIGKTIYGAMVTNIMWPVFEFFMFWGLRVLFRMLDQRRCFPKSKPESTSSKTLQGFEKIY